MRSKNNNLEEDLLKRGGESNSWRIMWAEEELFIVYWASWLVALVTEVIGENRELEMIQLTKIKYIRKEMGGITVTGL